MKEILVIRHGEKDGDDITPAGIVACKSLAQKVGDFTIAIASETHRAVQTAELVSRIPVETDARVNVPAFPDSELDMLAAGQATHPLGIIGAIWENESLKNDAREAGLKLQDLVSETIASLPDDGRALIVSHDGTMIALEKLLKGESFDAVDHSFGPLQGLRIDEQLHVQSFV